MSRFTKNEFNPNSLPTIGAEFSTKSVMADNKEVRVQVWDTVG